MNPDGSFKMFRDDNSSSIWLVQCRLIYPKYTYSLIEVHLKEIIHISNYEVTRLSGNLFIQTSTLECRFPDNCGPMHYYANFDLDFTRILVILRVFTTLCLGGNKSQPGEAKESNW